MAPSKQWLHDPCGTRLEREAKKGLHKLSPVPRNAEGFSRGQFVRPPKIPKRTAFLRGVRGARGGHVAGEGATRPRRLKRTAETTIRGALSGCTSIEIRDHDEFPTAKHCLAVVRCTKHSGTAQCGDAHLQALPHLRNAKTSDV